jgi:membrane-anchored mycosin MYCP
VRARRTLAGLAVAVLAVPVVPVVPGLGLGAAPAEAALVDTDCAEVAADDQAVETTAPSVPYDRLGMAAAWQVFERRGRVPGAGVRVAVVDSGVSPAAGLPVVEQVSFSDSLEPGDYHGTAVAGLVAAPVRGGSAPLPVGFAPGAELVDVRVYDSVVPDEGEVGLEAPRVAAGLRWVADNADRLRIGVVNVSLTVEPTDELEAAVRAVVDQDVVVVAESGSRPQDGEPLFDVFGGEPKRGEDAAGAIFPAGYDDVVGVAATADGASTTGEPVDVRGAVLQSSAVDVAVPTYDAVTSSLAGGTCLLPSVLTSWAAAEVSGVVALMRARFADDNARQVVSRLLDTADGSPANPTVLTGAGVVQPLEALTRPLRPGRDGTMPDNAEERDTNPRAQAPVPPEDRLAQTRRNAVWLGLIGGAALAIAALLRPLLRRRRAADAG